MVPIVTLGDAAPILLGMAAIFSATAALAAVDSRLLRRISREQEILDRLPETCGEPGSEPEPVRHQEYRLSASICLRNRSNVKWPHGSGVVTWRSSW